MAQREQELSSRIELANKRIGELETEKKVLEKNIATSNKASAQTSLPFVVDPSKSVVRHRYDITELPLSQMIEGQVGRYFVVDLKNARKKARYLFEPGRYRIDLSDGGLQASITAFFADMSNVLDANDKAKLYVRGSADILPFKSNLRRNNEYVDIDYLPAIGGGRYSGPNEKRIFSSELTNDDLPYLRSAFLKTVVNELTPGHQVFVLEGKQSSLVSAEERNAELILFVPNIQ